MATDAVAPWAEPALITADVLLTLADNSWRYELVQGRLVRMPPTGFEHGEIEMQIGSTLHVHVKPSGLGRVVGATGFLVSRVGEPDTVLAPDAAFIRTDRLPPRDSQEAQDFLRLCPDLVVEIGSPSHGRAELGAKAKLWLAHGAQFVWVIWPGQSEADVWRHGEDRVHTLTVDDVVDGDNVVPGFSYSLRDLFA